MTKRIIAFLLAFVFVLTACSVGFLAFAEGSDSSSDKTEPTRYSVIDSKASSIVISGVTAKCSGSVIAKYSTNLRITLELQKLSSGSYSTVKTWTDSRTGVTITVSGSKVINVFSTYRLKVTTQAGNETVIEYKYP